MLAHYHITQQGESHIATGTVCQDFSDSRRIAFADGGEAVIAGIADGVGSCLHSEYGSKTAVCTALDFLERNLTPDGDPLPLLKEAFQQARWAVEDVADAHHWAVPQLDSTLTVAVYRDQTLWFGHIGDDGIIALFTDGTYDLVTARHQGEEAHSLYPLAVKQLWEFKKVEKPVASMVLMTDGVLDYYRPDWHDDEGHVVNIIFYPFLKFCLESKTPDDAAVEEERKFFDDYFSGSDEFPNNTIRSSITDDITFVCVKDSKAVDALPEIRFDQAAYEAAAAADARYTKRMNEALEKGRLDERKHRKPRPVPTENEQTEAEAEPEGAAAAAESEAPETRDQAPESSQGADDAQGEEPEPQPAKPEAEPAGSASGQPGPQKAEPSKAEPRSQKPVPERRETTAQNAGRASRPSDRPVKPAAASAPRAEPKPPRQAGDGFRNVNFGRAVFDSVVSGVRRLGNDVSSWIDTLTGSGTAPGEIPSRVVLKRGDGSSRTVERGRKLRDAAFGEVYEAKDARTGAVCRDIALVLYDPVWLSQSGIRNRVGPRLTAMLNYQNAPNYLLLPKEIAHSEQDNALVGYSIPRDPGALLPFDDLFDEAKRSAFCNAGRWQHMLCLAANLARTIGYLHKQEIIVGDLDPRYIYVTQNGGFLFCNPDAFRLVDYASGGADRPGFGCDPDFVPPEFAKRGPCSLDDVNKFDRQSDVFGMAILIYALLTGGRHPYSLDSREADSTIPQNIRENRCLFSQSDFRPERIPTLDHQPLNNKVVGLFRQTFIDRSETAGRRSPAPERPTAMEWTKALSGMYQTRFPSGKR